MGTLSPVPGRTGEKENVNDGDMARRIQGENQKGPEEMQSSCLLTCASTEGMTECAKDKTAREAEKQNGNEIESEVGGENVQDGSKRPEANAAAEPKAKRKKAKRGVIYLSRLPPNIEITSVRTLLSRTGKITNMWLRPETREQQKQRISLGGSRRRTTFRDGWVEYSSRKDARETVQLLNGRPMTGAKRKGRWANDLWCMKFLPSFEWRHLTAEIFGGRERILRVREEMAAARQQRNWVEERSRLAEQFRRKGELGNDVEPVRRFLQKRSVPETAFDDDYDEKRARQAAARVDEELESGTQAAALNEELIKLLVKTVGPSGTSH